MTTFRSELRKHLFVVVAALVSSACDPRPPVRPVPRASAVSDDGAVLGLRFGQPTTMYALARHALSSKGVQAAGGWQFGGNTLGGGKVGALPQSLPLLVVSVLGLPPLAAGRLAEQGDWLAVVSQTPERAATWALAVPLQSGSEFVAELTLGAGAPRRAVARRGWIGLEGPNWGALGAMCVGVASNVLLFGPTCAGVETLVGRLTSENDVAPAVRATGISLRLLTQTSVLQGVYAAWGERVWSTLEALVSPSSDVFPPGVGTALSLLNATLSAYLGHIESGELTLELEGSRLAVNGSFGAKSLPPRAREQNLCEALSAIPTETQLWLAGIGDHDHEGRLPDWDSDVGEWENSIVSALAFAVGTAFIPATGVPVAGGPWVVGVRNSGPGRTFWALLQGLTPAYLAASDVPAFGERSKPLASVGQRTLPANDSGLVTRTSLHGGRSVEWGFAPWQAGVAVAVGAPLGAQWEAWNHERRAGAVSPVLRSSSCVGVEGALGVGSFAELVVVRVPQGLELKGLVDVTGQWSTTR